MIFLMGERPEVAGKNRRADEFDGQVGATKQPLVIERCGKAF
jgi:hypothetical protein